MASGVRMVGHFSASLVKSENKKKNKNVSDKSGSIPQTCLQGIHTFCVASIPDSAERGPIDPEMYSKLCSFQEQMPFTKFVRQTVLHTKNKPGSKAEVPFAHQ